MQSALPQTNHHIVFWGTDNFWFEPNFSGADNTEDLVEVDFRYPLSCVNIDVARSEVTCVIVYPFVTVS